MTCESYNVPHGKAVWSRRVRRAALLSVVAVLPVLSGCSDTVRTGQASSFLVLTTLQGGAGTAGPFGSVLQSDVLNVDPASGAASIAPDRGQASFSLQMKDPGGLAPSPVNSITITQYHVEYVRSDGRNTQGIDVPFAFDGGVTVTIDGTGSVGFTLVRVQAKQEAPLQGMARGGAANTISTIARVTFFGHDQTGREVSVTGNIEVDFSDWAG